MKDERRLKTFEMDFPCYEMAGAIITYGDVIGTTEKVRKEHEADMYAKEPILTARMLRGRK